MKVIQVLPTISFGDAVGNDALAIKKLLKEEGYDTEIYAENIDKKLPKRSALSLNYMPKLNKNDIIIYHNSTGTDINYKIENFGARIIMIYHNITPPEFFRDYSYNAEKLTKYGLDGVKYLKNKVDYCLADSNFNKSNLLDMGYNCKIDVRPILIPFEDYKKTHNNDIIKKYDDGFTNILFVGRIAPNKKQEDIIKTFCYYKKYINPKSRLILVGSDSGMENYAKRLKDYIRVLGVEDVVFPGHIKFDEILAFYKVADIFLCMSEHEGFCVPLVEAMFFNIPIIAYDSSAISDTLGDSGILFNDKNPVFVSRLIDKCINDKELKEYIIEKENQRLEDFSYDRIKNMFMHYITNFIDEN